MRKIALTCAALAALAVTAPTLEAREKLTGEARLAKLLEGREAGQPVSCISTSNTQNLEIVDKTALVYKSGSTYYVNRPSDASRLDDDDILVTELHGSQLCRLDMVRMHDRTGGWYRGFIPLGDFVPYRRIPGGKG